jgi:hypothetical protein
MGSFDRSGSNTSSSLKRSAEILARPLPATALFAEKTVRPTSTSRIHSHERPKMLWRSGKFYRIRILYNTMYIVLYHYVFKLLLIFYSMFDYALFKILIQIYKIIGYILKNHRRQQFK